MSQERTKIYDNGEYLTLHGICQKAPVYKDKEKKLYLVIEKK